MKQIHGFGTFQKLVLDKKNLGYFATTAKSPADAIKHAQSLDPSPSDVAVGSGFCATAGTLSSVGCRTFA